ncbi:MAG TPA: hypothetical protein VGC90_09870 [Candidatus Limnocylindrales bacterium]
MRIAYFGHVNGGSQSGVFRKIVEQVDRWRIEGHTVRAFIATRDDTETWRSALGQPLVARYDGPLSRLRAMTRLVAGVRRFEPDVLYVRWDLFYPPMLWFPRAPLALEINTDDVAEYALGRRVRELYNRATRGILMRRARAMVFVTQELSGAAAFRRYHGRHLVVTNGIDLRSFPSLAAPDNPRPRLVFVGSAGQPWQGVDKVVTLAALRPDWGIDVVGISSPEREATPNITWHGSLDRPDVLRVLARADAAIGTLALHRKGLSEASPLKVREYLAVGIPTFYGCSDPDADGLGRFVLRIANTETNVVDEIDRIDDFVHRSRGARVPRASVGHIDRAEKERQRLALLAEIASR